MGLRFLTIFFYYCSPADTGATPARGGEILDYTLRVSFDIPASRISGLAKIPVQERAGNKIK